MTFVGGLITLRNHYHNQTNRKMTQVSTKHPS